MIVSGSRDAIVQAIQSVNIHGTILYDIVYRHGDEAQPRQARLGAESVYTNPRPGDAVRVSYLMNVATAITLR